MASPFGGNSPRVLHARTISIPRDCCSFAVIFLSKSDVDMVMCRYSGSISRNEVGAMLPFKVFRPQEHGGFYVRSPTQWLSPRGCSHNFASTYACNCLEKNSIPRIRARDRHRFSGNESVEVDGSKGL